MTRYFFDTSAIFKRYVQENGSDTVESIFKSDGEVLISSLVVTEVISNLRRLSDVSRTISQAEFNRLKAFFFADIAGGRIGVVEPVMQDFIQSVELISSTYMTPVDALQLAIAIRLADDDTLFVCSDRKLLGIAGLYGLNVLDPSAD